MNSIIGEEIITKLIPVLSKKEKSEIMLYHKAYEKHVDTFALKAMKELKKHPVFGELIKNTPKEEADERSKINSQLQKDAIFNDNWKPYIKSQILNGITYAKMGLEFSAWYEIVTLARKFIIPSLEIEYGYSAKLISAMSGMNRLFDIGMGVIGEAYVQEKKGIINEDRKKIKLLNKSLEQKIFDRTIKLELAYKELEQFSYIASHDLQEPLRTIANFAGLLEEKFSGNNDEEVKEYFDFILSAISKMQTLIKDVLELSTIGKDLTKASVDCNKIVEDVIVQLDTTIKETNAKITSFLLPIINGNEIEMKQLFQNLISNALKFRKKNTTLEIEIKVEEKEKEFLFSIKNNGIGIEEQNKERIFEIFQRLHSEVDYPGTGIGLATCKKVVDQYNGKIWVESEFGEGSIFYFTINKNN